MARRHRVGPPAVVAVSPDSTIEITGNLTTNSLPMSGPWLWALMVPPCNSTRFLAKLNPMPPPSWDRPILRSPCKNKSKTFGSKSASMPMPVSRTRMTTWLWTSSTSSQTSPPSGVYFPALISKLKRICSKRVGSASRQIDSSGIETWSSCRCSSNERSDSLDCLSDHRSQFHDSSCEVRSCHG